MAKIKEYTQKVLANGEEYLSEEKDSNGKIITKRRNHVAENVIPRFRFIVHKQWIN